MLVLVLVNQNFIGTRDEYEYDDEDEVCSCRAVSPGVHIVSQKVTGVRCQEFGSGNAECGKKTKFEFVSLCLLYPIRAGELNFLEVIMAKEIIVSSEIPKPMGPYSQAVAATGSKFIFISGQVPEDAQGKLIGKGDIEKQTRQVLKNIKTMVERSSGTIADIVKITIFMVDINPSSYEIVAGLRRKFFGGDYPASTLVEVQRLASPDWLIEIEAVAVV